MARYISAATGNFTTLATWDVVDATSLLDSEAGNTALTTSYVTSSTFTPGAITIDGIAVKIASLSAGLTGTITVALDQGGSDVIGTPVTLNVSDLGTASLGADAGWVFFKFTAPVLLVVATAYSVKAKTSSATQVNLYRDATAGNWSRLLRTTTNPGALSAGDTFDVMGEHTGATTGNSFVVTMDNTATTDFGVGTDSVVALTICKRGALSYGTTAATNYYLKLSGDLYGYNGGTLNIGTTGTPIPRDSTAVLEFDPVADGGMGFVMKSGFTFTSQGQSRTSGKNVVKCKLTVDKAIAATSFTVDTDTGWLNGDVFCVGKTNRSTSFESETLTLSGGAGASTLTSTAGCAAAHKGTGILWADVGLLTRNVVIRSATSTIMTYILVGATANVDIDWTEIYYVGSNISNKKGIEVNVSSSGTFTMNYSSLHDCEVYGFLSNTSSGSITVSDNVFYNLNSSSPAGVTISSMIISATSGVHTITNNIIMHCKAGNNGTSTIQLNDIGSVFTGNLINDCSNSGMTLEIGEGGVINSFTNNVISCTPSGGTHGIQIGFSIASAAGISGTFETNTVLMCQSAGLDISSVPGLVVFNNWILAGNSTSAVRIETAGFTSVFNTCTFCGSTGFTTTNGVLINGSSGATFNSCSLGVVTGNYIANTNDVNTSGGYIDYLFNNCLFGSATLVTGYTSMLPGGIIRFQKYQQTTNSHRWYTTYGSAMSTGSGLTDTNVRTAGSLGLRIAPENLTTGFSWSFKILAKANSAVSVSGFLQKNATFGSSVATVSLFLPGSTTADATQTMPNDTSWDVFALGANYTGTVDLYATVTINAKTSTASAYIYVDDIYNGTNHITALDVWDNAQPSTILYEQLGDASAVWAVLTSTQTTSGTMGYLVTKLLTVAKFLGLK